MQRRADELRSAGVPAGEGFFDALASGVFAAWPAETAAGDLSSLLILVPALPLAGELRGALLRASPRPMLLPRFATLAQWLQAEANGIADPAPASQRLVLLHEALRERGWFDESALWAIAAEMADLFDELSAAALTLPADADALARQLERAYALRASEPLAFEARVVHELWRALAGAGALDRAAVHRLRLQAVLDAAAKSHAAGRALSPLCVVLDAEPAEALSPAEVDFLLHYGEFARLALFHPLARSSEASPLLATLNAAWPEGATSAPLYLRAAELAAKQATSPLAGRLSLVAADGREQEAQAAVAQVGQWLSAGEKRIVLIAQDRLSARRVRALLEREQVLLADEGGWKVSTSRAAAALDALLETVASGAYYRDLVDLCKSPFVFADVDDDKRKAAVFALESALRARSVKSGLARSKQSLRGAEGDPASLALAWALLERVEAATALLKLRPQTLSRWLDHLLLAIDALGARAALAGDAAGAVVLDLLETRHGELAETAGAALFSLASMRDWLNREFEAAAFRDTSIVSPVVLTTLRAVRLRRFDAAILLGGDASLLAPAAGGKFFNHAVRRELGLPGRIEAERELRHDLELLLATVPRVVVTWQAQSDGEAKLLAPELSLVSTLHALAWQDDLRREALPAREAPAVDALTAPQATVPARPVAPAALLPQRVSVSAYAALVACPYRFFARYVLRLGEIAEVSEEMDKSEYGALVHRVLERFHAAHPLVSALAPAEAAAELKRVSDEVFAAAIGENFLATGWAQRWQKRHSAYLDWQRAREDAGWRWDAAEAAFSRGLALADGDTIEFYGRIDRIDRRADGAVSLLDYKTQNAKVIGDKLADDVQLPSYALLHGAASEAAYVALEDERVVSVASAASAERERAEAALMDAAAAQGDRLAAAMSALRAGASLPAHGAAKACKWCEISGLCRKDHV